MVDASDIGEIEVNDTLATAQNIDGSFSIGANPDIGSLPVANNPLTVPWVSIAGAGDDTVDYYSFTVVKTFQRIFYVINNEKGVED